MVNEAVLVFETDVPIPMTVADGVGIEKGTILKISDLMTASAANGNNDMVAGIAAEEKIASDGKLKIGVYRHGIFKVIASGAINVGDALGTCLDSNYVCTNKAQLTLSGSKILGTALETAADEETFLIELNPQVVNCTV